jgi:ParB/RepB/Spo0J family partition protein
MKPINDIPISQIIPGKNDRTIFDESGLRELADSIKEHGLIQPLTVRHAKDGKRFEIVAGERRFRACKLLGWNTIPAIVTDLKDEDASAITLAENIARKSLDPIDEACAYQSRIESFGWSMEDLSKYAGTSTIHILFRLKLLKLIPEIQKLIRGANIQIGYAQILADANLDSNFQLLAFSKLRDNPKPTMGWFRSIVLELKEKQNQGILFKGPLFDKIYDASGVKSENIPEPPHPETTTPPKIGRNYKEILLNQIDFWEEAAKQWDAIGKPFKRNECRSAAQALGQAIRKKEKRVKSRKLQREKTLDRMTPKLERKSSRIKLTTNLKGVDKAPCVKRRLNGRTGLGIL